jgi:hypothetical protein
MRVMCRVVRACAPAAARGQALKLCRVAGLTDAGIASLSRVTALRELSVEAPLNRALTQGSLAQLAPLRELRCVRALLPVCGLCGVHRGVAGCVVANPASRPLCESTCTHARAHVCACARLPPPAPRAPGT